MNTAVNQITDLVEAPVEATAESVHALRRDATIMVTDMIAHVTSIREKLGDSTDPSATKLRRETDRLLDSLAAASPGVVDLKPFLQARPRQSDFQFEARADVLAIEARSRLQKSQYMFPSPLAVIDAAASLWPSDNVDDKNELRVRIAYYLNKMNVVRDGLGVSAACRRLLEAAACNAAQVQLTEEQVTLLASAKASLQSFMYEARKHVRI